MNDDYLAHLLTITALAFLLGWKLGLYRGRQQGREQAEILGKEKGDG